MMDLTGEASVRGPSHLGHCPLGSGLESLDKFLSCWVLLASSFLPNNVRFRPPFFFRLYMKGQWSKPLLL